MFQAVQEMSICMGGRYGLFRGEWVKALLSYNFTKYSKKRKIRRLRGNLVLLIGQLYMYIIFTCTLI